MKTFVKYLFIAFFLLFSSNGFAQKSLTDFIDGMKNSSNPEQFVPQIKKELTPYLNGPGSRKTIKEAFQGKEVDLTYSDAYLNSALSIIITASFIKQIRDDLGFTIKNLNIIYDQKYFKGENEKPYAYEKDDYEVEISTNFLYRDDRDDYLRNTMKEIIGMAPLTPSANGVEHHRYLSISVVNGTANLDIRPDRGLASGWVTCRNVCYDKIELVGENVDIRKKNINIDMLYYLIFNK